MILVPLLKQTLTTRNLLIVLASIIVGLLSRYCYRYKKYRRAFGDIPTCDTEFFFLKKFLKGEFNIIGLPFSAVFFRELLKIIDPYVNGGILLAWLFQPILFLFDDEYTKLFSTERATAGKAPFVYRILQEMIGKGLVTTDAASWKFQRKTLNPAFRVDLLKGNVPLINTGAKLMVKKLEKCCNEPTAEVVNVLKLGSLKVLCGTMLGLDVNSEEYDCKMRRYLELLDTLAAYTMYRIPRPWLYWKKTNMLFPSGWKHRSLYKEFHQFTNNLVMQMVEKYSPANSKTGDEDSELYGGGKQFVRLLLDTHAKDPTFTLQNVQDEVTSIIFGGHDTTAYTLLWSLYLLGLNPEAQKKAFEEAESVIGDGTDYSFADTSKLEYIECVIKETLRIYPTVPLFGRVIDKDVQCGKYKILKDTVIIFSPMILHNNPKYFPNPKKFDPERFLGNDVKPWTYIPFSEGMRSCIGKKYGMLVMKIAIAHILRNFEITSLDKREDIQMDWHILMTPTTPLRFQLTPRHPTGTADSEQS